MARFCGGFWAANSVICIGFVFAGSGCVFLYGFSYLIKGVLVFFAVFGTLGPRFRGLVLPFSSPSLFFPLSLSGSAWVLFLFFSCSCRQDRPFDGGRSGLAHDAHVALSFLLSLPGRPPLPCPFLSLSVFLSFFLSSFSLSLLQACVRRHPRLRSKSGSGLFPDFFRNFLRKVPAKRQRGHSS